MRQIMNAFRAYRCAAGAQSAMSEFQIRNDQDITKGKSTKACSESNRKATQKRRRELMLDW